MHISHPHMSKFDVIATIVSGTIEATALAWWVNRRWFCGKEAKRVK